MPGGAQREGGQGGQVRYYYVSRQPASNANRDADRNYGSMNHPSDAQNAQTRGPAPTRPSQQPPQQQQPETGSSSNADGESRPPPTYAEAVKGDHKVQSPD